MSFSNIIDGDAAAPLIPAEHVPEVIKATAQASAALQLCVLRNMSTKSATWPVLSTLPVAYWVDDGLKQTTGAEWGGLELTAEEIAVIVPVKDEVLEDSAFPIWNELRDPIGQAFAQRLDDAVFAGADKPRSWPDGLIPAAIAAGNEVAGGSTPEQGGVLNDAALTMDMVEAGGYEVTAFAAKRSLKGAMRRQRNAVGDLQAGFITDRMWDVPIGYAVTGAFPDDALLLAGDFGCAVMGVRQDMRFEIFREGVITDVDGKILLNLLQEDSSAMRITGRWAFQVAQPVTLEGEGFPFAVLEDAGGATRTAKAPAAKKS